MIGTNNCAVYNMELSTNQGQKILENSHTFGN